MILLDSGAAVAFFFAAQSPAMAAKSTDLRAVLPGDPIDEAGRHGRGIVEGRAVLAGRLCRISDLLYVRARGSVYLPERFDIVVGKVSFTCSDYYRVDVSGFTGLLPALSFPGAVKRNKPVLQKGEWVAARVVRVADDLLLSCKEEGLGAVDEVFWLPAWRAERLYADGLPEEIRMYHACRVIAGLNGGVAVTGAPLARRDVIQLLQRL